MFQTISRKMAARLDELEKRDAADRTDGTPHMLRLRQIPKETGQFLALSCANAPKGKVLEIGTSAGYSSLWLILACIERGDHLTTFEVLPEKVLLARETFQITEVEDHVNLIHGDARQLLKNYADIAFCFLDAEKDVYMDCYEQLMPKLLPGGIIIADNLISHAKDLQSFKDHVMQDPNVDAVLVPIGKGELFIRKI